MVATRWFQPRKGAASAAVWWWRPRFCLVLKASYSPAYAGLHWWDLLWERSWLQLRSGYWMMEAHVCSGADVGAFPVSASSRLKHTRERALPQVQGTEDRTESSMSTKMNKYSRKGSERRARARQFQHPGQLRCHGDEPDCSSCGSNTATTMTHTERLVRSSQHNFIFYPSGLHLLTHLIQH